MAALAGGPVRARIDVQATDNPVVRLIKQKGVTIASTF